MSFQFLKNKEITSKRVMDILCFIHTHFASDTHVSREIQKFKHNVRFFFFSESEAKISLLQSTFTSLY